MNPLKHVAAGALLLSAAAALAQPPQQGQSSGPPMVANVEYVKLETREATERRILGILNPTAGEWGAWYVLAPFPYHMQNGPKLAEAQIPEAELANMKVNGPGPDLAAEYRGKNGAPATWRPVGDRRNKEVTLNTFDDQALNDYACSYIYTTVTVPQPTTITVSMGSDDGLRFWLNGRLLVDDDVLRGLDPEESKVKLDLGAGVNHLFAKVANMKGGYAFQINTAAPLDQQTANQLEYLLNLDFPSSPEDEYYRAVTVSLPPDVVLEVGGLDVLPPDARGECRPIVCTRRGEVWIIEGAYKEPAFDCTFKRFAYGMHEPLGLSVRVEKDAAGKPVTAVYCVQRGELTRLVDTDGDDVADLYQTFSDAWGVSGNYHEFAFGPKFDAEGNAWVTLNVGFCGALGKSVAPYRGWALKFAPDGTMTPVSDGLRSPNGIGHFGGAAFYVDNQGDYVGTNRMTELAPGSWAGHPCTLGWREDWKKGMPAPERKPATIWFPYKKMGQSAADILPYLPDSQIEGVRAALAAEKFGPFAGQVFVGDQTLCMVNRVFLERVDGHWQGACFPFRKGLDCGVNRLAWGGDGSMFVGQTDRGWGSIGRLRYGVQRLAWTGKTPFEVLTMSVKPGGFELTFTKDLDPAAAADPASYSMLSYTYEYHEPYGSDEMEKAPQTVTAARLLGPRSVFIAVDTLRSGGEGYVHELALPGVRDAEGRPLLHPVAYYTLVKMPPDTLSATSR